MSPLEPRDNTSREPGLLPCGLRCKRGLLHSSAPGCFKAGLGDSSELRLVGAQPSSTQTLRRAPQGDSPSKDTKGPLRGTGKAGSASRLGIRGCLLCSAVNPSLCPQPPGVVLPCHPWPASGHRGEPARDLLSLLLPFQKPGRRRHRLRDTEHDGHLHGPPGYLPAHHAAEPAARLRK